MTQSIIERFKFRLNNLNANSKSIVMMRCLKSQDLDLHQLDFLNEISSHDLLKKIIKEQREKATVSVRLIPQVDARNAAVNAASKQLLNVLRRSNVVLEERGSHDLHLAFPFVQGRFNDGTIVRAPLCYFPVELYVEKGWFHLRKRVNESPTFNQSFLLAYSLYNNIALPKSLLDLEFDGQFTDLQSLLNFLYEQLKFSELNIHFNQQLFDPVLQSFEHLNRASLTASTEDGTLKLQPLAVLGMFPQADSFLLPDYEQMIQQNLSIEDIFKRSANEWGAEAPTIHEADIITPLPLDASQENAIIKVKQGRSLVVQGPPGTGKSQLIANLAADAMANGQKVLLICQKRAALDVVFERLASLGIGPSMALVHDIHSDRKAVYNQIFNRIQRSEELIQSPPLLQTLQLRQQFDQAAHRIEEISAQLESYKETLYDQSRCGLNLKYLYLHSNPKGTRFNLQDHPPQLHQWDNTHSNLLSLLRYGKRWYSPQHPWIKRKSVANWNNAKINQLEQLSTEVDALQKLSAHMGGASQVSSAILQKELLASYIAWHKGTHLNHIDWLIIGQPQLPQLVEELNGDNQYLLNLLLGGIELDLSLEQVNALLPKVEEALLKTGSFFSSIIYKLFGSNKNVVQLALRKNNLDWKGLNTLHQHLVNRQRYERKIQEMSSLWPSLPTAASTRALNAWHTAWTENFSQVNVLVQFHGLLNYEGTNAINKAEALYIALTHAENTLQELDDYLHPSQVTALLNGSSFANLTAALRNDLDWLKEYDRLAATFNSIILVLAEQALALSDSSSTAEQLAQTVANTLFCAWIEILEEENPIARAASTGKLAMLEQEIQDAVALKNKLSKELLLARLDEEATKNIEYNRLNNQVTYKELKHQTGKQRLVWPMRRLLAEYGWEIFQLVPFWLASPETVSALFPLEEVFDLVIFDEASQCFSERGLPGIMRGKQVVIAGDSKQLRPFDLYSTRFEDEDVEDNALEAESLLELASQHVEEIMLTGHYRSRSPELIAFSNKHFYQNKLYVLPHKDDFNAASSAVHYINAGGVWKNNSNEAEAHAVLALILRLQKEQPLATLGVVTFNFPQQALISELIEEHFAQLQQPLPAHLFVKNIENVQGDERDIIIFSVAYAPDENDRMVSHFGSLSTMGGENRLNVAVTRAREEIYLVCSIQPEQLKVDNSRNMGPQLLRDYIAFARDSSTAGGSAYQLDLNPPQGQYLLSTRIFEQEGKRFASLPFSDLALREGSDLSHAVFTDDVFLYNSRSPKEFYVYIPGLLKLKKWPYVRFFTRQYWQQLWPDDLTPRN